MTAGNNGASTPEDDDPFGYLYEDGQAQGGNQRRQGGYGYPGPAAQPGVPRTSYNQVRTVGERQYGQPQVPPQQGHGQQPAYGQQPQYGQQPAYGQAGGQASYGQQPSAPYAAPETYPGADTTRHVPAQRGSGGGRGGPNTRGLLIGAIAVVVVVVIGITAALLSSGDDGQDDEAASSGGPSVSASEDSGGKPSEGASEKPAEGIQLPKQDAATLKLGPPAALDTAIKGAEGTNGAYVAGFNAVGASVTWTADIEKAGAYALSVRYAIPAKDANATLTVNGKANSNPIGLKNFIHSSDPNWEKNWQTTWAPVELQAGQNTIKISCEQGNQCDAILDWLEVTPPKN
ncbi:CBM35 domain-containing protein [Streptomyces sp. NPDC056672]|uniref:CBM35 domain-containing protein n=1 Tax=Streptomyces sp. NPDC056672 TaxID=3345906 RepID=UPI003696AA60